MAAIRYVGMGDPVHAEPPGRPQYAEELWG